jgi:hypothetical protein
MSESPEVTYPDIVNYLVYTQSAYTLAELKAYKSLQGYNYFISGFVQDIGHALFSLASDFFAFSNDIFDITHFVYSDLQDGGGRNALWVIDRWMENNL